MNLNVLRYVIAVSEEKSVTKASRRLYVSQPSLSQSIQALEDDLGAKLFDRSKTPLETTAAGEIFVQWARGILSSEQQMRRNISDFSSRRQRKLTVGITPQRNKRIIPYILQEFYAATTDCAVVLDERFSRDLELLLERNCIDLLIDQPNPDVVKYESIPIFNEMILVAAPEAYGLTVVGSDADQPGEYPVISVTELADKPFIMLLGNKYIEDSFHELFRRMGRPPTIVLECLSPQVAHTMVSLNTGITLLPEYNIKRAMIPAVRYYTVREYPISRTVAAIYRKDRPLSDDAAAMISILKDKCAAAIRAAELYHWN